MQSFGKDEINDEETKKVGQSGLYKSQRSQSGEDSLYNNFIPSQKIDETFSVCLKNYECKDSPVTAIHFN